MRRLLTYFLRGLAFVAPIAITVYVCVRLFIEIDSWLGPEIDTWTHVHIPGLGFVLTIAVITFVGFLGSTLLARGLLASIDQLIDRLPFVRLLYSSTKDLLNAFVGEQRRFETPVLVPAPDSAGGPAKALGFLTQDHLTGLGPGEFVTVYLPFAYSLSGRLFIYPAADVTHLDIPSADVMAFIISGGVTALPTNDPPRGP
jgi:uncharacterized membrane protein